MTRRSEVLAELRAAGKYLMDHGLAWGNAGNLSARIDADRYLITASGTYLGELGEDDFAECSLVAGGVHGHAAQTASSAAGKKPSKEVPMHRAIYEARPDIGAVLHASPLYSTLFACAEETLPSGLFVETMYYLEQVERVPYAHPGSAELGEAVREKAKRANVLLLEHHGVLVYDATVKEARMALHALETACRMIVEARGAGIALRELPEAVRSDFLEHSGYRPRRKWEA